MFDATSSIHLYHVRLPYVIKGFTYLLTYLFINKKQADTACRELCNCCISFHPLSGLELNILASLVMSGIMEAMVEAASASANGNCNVGSICHKW